MRPGREPEHHDRRPETVHPASDESAHRAHAAYNRRSIGLFVIVIALSILLLATERSGFGAILLLLFVLWEMMRLYRQNRRR